MCLSNTCRALLTDQGLQVPHHQIDVDKEEAPVVQDLALCANVAGYIRRLPISCRRREADSKVGRDFPSSRNECSAARAERRRSRPERGRTPGSASRSGRWQRPGDLLSRKGSSTAASHAQYGRDDRIPEVREAFTEIGTFMNSHLKK